jgi:hypothetical protein
MVRVGILIAILDVELVTTSLPTILKVAGHDPDQMRFAYLVQEIISIQFDGDAVISTARDPRRKGPDGPKPPRRARPRNGTSSRYSSRPGLEYIGARSDLLSVAAQSPARNTRPTPDLAHKTGRHLRECHGNDLPLWFYQQP